MSITERLNSAPATTPYDGSVHLRGDSAAQLDALKDALASGNKTVIAAALRDIAAANDVEDFEFLEVGQFNAKFSLPTVYDGPPRMLSEAEARYRFEFMLEEVTEFRDAFKAGDFCGMIDALHDIVYVAKGTSHFMRVPWRKHWLEVQCANMAKEKGPSGKARTAGIDGVDEAFEVRKPPGWKGPNHMRVLNDYVYVNHRTDG